MLGTLSVNTNTRSAYSGRNEWTPDLSREKKLQKFLLMSSPVNVLKMLMKILLGKYNSTSVRRRGQKKSIENAMRSSLSWNIANDNQYTGEGPEIKNLISGASSRSRKKRWLGTLRRYWIYVHTLAMHDLPVGGSNRRFVSEKEAPNVDSPQ